MNHPVFARLYARRAAAGGPVEHGYRRELLDGLSGRVLELGCGDGRNFAFYPSTVSEVVAVEPEPYLRRRARDAPRSIPRVTVVKGRAETPAGAVNGQFDAAVFSLLLCSVANPAVVLREAKAVLREGASVRFFEHVISPDDRLARWQRLAAPWWSRVAGGCRPDRDLLPLIQAEFLISQARHFDHCPGPRIPLRIVEPHVLVRATVSGPR